MLLLVSCLRRLRRNQSAVNEGLIDAVRGLLGLVREMGGELDAMNAKLKDLQMQLSEQRVQHSALAAESEPAPGCEQSSRRRRFPSLPAERNPTPPS